MQLGVFGNSSVQNLTIKMTISSYFHRGRRVVIKPFDVSVKLQDRHKLLLVLAVIPKLVASSIMTLSSTKSSDDIAKSVHESLQQIQQGVTEASGTTSGIAVPAVTTSIEWEALQRQKLARILDEAIAIAELISRDAPARKR